MTRYLVIGALAITAVAAVAAPAAAQSKREMQMMADIRMLQEQTQQLQQQLATALAQLGETLKQLSSRQDDQTAATRKGFADQKLTVDQVGSDLRVVKERVDETNVRITSLSQEVEALRVAIPSYPPPSPPTDTTLDPAAAAGTGAVPPPSGGQTSPSTAGGPPPVAPMPASTNPGISPQRLYDTAWTDYTAGQWTLCIEGFNTYLRSFPRSEAADDAQFYIGECNFADGKYTEAMDAYNRVIANYPRADKAPDAYYKRGMTFERLGQLDRARESWETLLKTFPDAEVARLGKQNLDRLARAKPRA
ncbi:MAG TPA: tetratricopeptide repeat protein [Vicinamibacterales bacterium]|nr:tetratricopeptide repeat protein [Vicinamibacterales bacterium]